MKRLAPKGKKGRKGVGVRANEEMMGLASGFIIPAPLLTVLFNLIAL